MSPVELTAALKLRARELGFALAGVCEAAAPNGVARLGEWLDRGYAGQMKYLHDRREAYAHPRYVLEGVRSLLLLGLPYRTVEAAPAEAGEGRVARYAWGEADYHDVIRDKLHDLADYLRELAPTATTRGVVDTAPLLEREFAQRAGLGWVGKNTLLLSRDAGSYFFLAALLTDVELAADEAFEADHCGTCTACLDACPTQAFPQAGVLDASRCISYLTIELRDHIPAELRPGMRDWVFGCDVCQEVCPWNRFAPVSEIERLQPVEAMNPLELTSLFAMDDDAFRRRFRKTPLWRPHRDGLLRNAAIVLGNQGRASALPALARGLNDVAPLVRAATAWALGRIAAAEPEAGAAALLRARLGIEEDATVRAEILGAMP
ncbi:tRNA epoxyqueuosine(34) reductase QueG [Lacipirellula parvula]|uniref:Epoxyqueuosine reductase n=1 Tax=Lacipirellula parvula TaxID=2650471 RepID=A0A5K7XC26_9BACT|nr:tRNA epoxyqueuosine(34) reductase QueG [Lacipirellula parvula]BBO33502.1 epoxyqueuosine reductase [Lacipirellula parvula]